jgi:hypothetical protein
MISKVANTTLESLRKYQSVEKRTDAWVRLFFNPLPPFFALPTAKICTALFIKTGLHIPNRTEIKAMHRPNRTEPCTSISIKDFVRENKSATEKRKSSRNFY